MLGLLVTSGMLAFGHGVCTPALTALFSQQYEAAQQGEVLGLSRSGTSLGRVMGPLWGGLVAEAFGIQYPFVLAGALLAVGLAVFVWGRAVFMVPRSMPRCGVNG
jgi:DHA1 family multidrug resistance protein-like MFS transporter